MVTEKSWKEFRETGLLLIINQILHIFGWAIVFIINDDSNEIIKVYPARVRFRGFTEKSIEKGYKDISKYMVDNCEDLLMETME